MTEEQLKNWFLNKFYFCYPVKHEDYPDEIYLFYDKLYLRKCVLLNILGKDIVLPKKVNGECLFYIDFKSNKLWCDSDKIWDFLEYNYTTNFTEVQSLISSWLDVYDELKERTILENRLSGLWLQDYDKLLLVQPLYDIRYHLRDVLYELDKLYIVK